VIVVALLLVLPVVVAGLVHQVVRRRDVLAGLSCSLDDVLFRGRAIFGANKTLRGFVVMPLACGAAFAVERVVFSTRLASLPCWTGLLVGAMYVAAELPNSMLKRRVGIAPGAQASRGRAFFFVLDHVDSALGCALAFRALHQSWPVVIAGLVLAPLLHVTVNRAAHAAGLRSAPW
jgi:hypothetical protein